MKGKPRFHYRFFPVKVCSAESICKRTVNFVLICWKMELIISYHHMEYCLVFLLKSLTFFICGQSKWWVIVHSRSKCLVWVKRCCHIWLDQNFDPSLLTNKLWHVFMGKKQKKCCFFESAFLILFFKKNFFGLFFP